MSTAAPYPRMHGRDHEHGGADVIRTAWETVGGGASALTAAMPFSADGVQAVANGVMRWYPLAAAQLVKVHAAVGVAPAGSGLTVRVNRNGTSVATVTVAAGTNAAVVTLGTPVAFVVGDYFTVDVTAVGSTTPGAGLVVQLGVT